MDVHAPHEPIHTWRDSFIHLGIVTVGLFIALSLEGLVEYVHHRHLVHQARTNIRRELEDNHQAAQQDVDLIQKTMNAQKANMATIREIKAHPGMQKKVSLDYTFSFNQPDDAAWVSARDTGALSFMPYDEVQSYSSVYKVQNLVNTKAIEILDQEELAIAPAISQNMDMEHLPSADLDIILHNSAAIYTQLDSLRQIVKELDQQYVTELKH